MPDSQPPVNGPDPYDGWDQEGLLSGESVWLPDGMRPVAATLAALRGAPMRAELADEGPARAMFREIMLAGPGGPGGTGDARTLILPARPASGGPPGAPRPRHSHRRPPRRRRWQSKALAGAAAGVAVVAGVGGAALAGVFSGAGGHPGTLGASAAGAASATSPASHPVSNGLDGSATKEPTAHPTPGRSQGQRPADESAALCRQYLAFLMHPESQSDWAREAGPIRQLSDLAGGSRHIIGYCIDLQQPWAMTPRGAGSGLGGPGLPPPDDSSGPSGADGPQVSQGENGLRHDGNGPGGSDGNGQDGDGSGSGGPGQH